MSRTVKFRVWTGEKMIYIGHSRDDTSIVFNENGWQVIDHLFGQPEIIADSETSELKEYTGLKDKNGTEIYEEDIYKRYNYIYRVVWNKEMASFKGICIGRKRDFEESYEPIDDYTLYQIQGYSITEVIGNAYENSELVTKEK